MREIAFRRISDPEVKKQVEANEEWKEHQREKEENQKRIDKECELRQQRVAKGLCPKCGGNCRFKITNRMKNSSIGGHMAYESKNLEPVEEGICLECGHTFISKSPQEVQDMWSRQNKLGEE